MSATAPRNAAWLAPVLASCSAASCRLRTYGLTRPDASAASNCAVASSSGRRFHASQWPQWACAYGFDGVGVERLTIERLRVDRAGDAVARLEELRPADVRQQVGLAPTGRRSRRRASARQQRIDRVREARAARGRRTLDPRHRQVLLCGVDGLPLGFRRAREPGEIAALAGGHGGPIETRPGAPGSRRPAAAGRPSPAARRPDAGGHGSPRRPSRPG